MGRRHRRADETVPLTITPADIPRPKPLPKSPEERRRERERRDEERWRREQATRKRQRTESVEWGRCMVPMCDYPLYPPPESMRDTDICLPLCSWHEAMVWRRVQRYNGRTDIYEATVKLDQEQRIRDEAEKRRRLANQEGHIYYLRLNGLIKVGWSRDIRERLRAYGPDVEVLCTHEGTRQDETTLHRNLRPFLARGREWYEDGAAMQDIIAKAIERHGRGYVHVEWTRPTEPPIKVRRK